MILIDQNNRAVFGDATGITETEAFGLTWRTTDFHTGNAALLDVPLPAGFVAGQFDLVDGVLVPNADYAPDLAGLRTAKNVEINAARLSANRGTFEHGGKVFACDELSRGDIDGVNGFVSLTQSLPPGWPGGWKAVDNSYHAIANVAAWIAFYAAMVATGNAHFAKAQTLKAQLAAATTPEEIGGVTW